MRICSRCKSKVNWAKDYCPLCAGSVIVVPDEQKTVQQTVPMESSVPDATPPLEVSAPPKPVPAQAPAEPPQPLAELAELNEELTHQSIGLKRQNPIVSDPNKDPSILQNEQKRIPVQGNEKTPPPSQQSEFLRQFPDASAGDSVFKEREEPAKTPTPAVQKEPTPDNQVSLQEDDGIPFMEINSDEGKSPLKLIPHAQPTAHVVSAHAALPEEENLNEEPMVLVDFEAIKQPTVSQPTVPQPSAAPQSEFLRQFPDASAGDSVFKEQEKPVKAPTPVVLAHAALPEEENLDEEPMALVDFDAIKQPTVSQPTVPQPSAAPQSEFLRQFPDASAGDSVFKEREEPVKASTPVVLAHAALPEEENLDEEPMALVDFDAIKQPSVPQPMVPPPSAAPQSEFLRQFPDASAGDSVFKKQEEQVKAPTPFVQKEPTPDNQVSFDEDDGIPVLEIHSDAGESYLKPISHHSKNVATPTEILPFEQDEEDGITVLEITAQNGEENSTAPQKDADSDYPLESAILKPLEMIEIAPDESFDEGLAIQKAGEVHIPAHAHKPDETVHGGLERALEIIFEEDPDGDGHPGTFTPSNSGSPTPPKPQQKTPEAGGRNESIQPKSLTRGSLEISKSIKQKKKSEVPIINTRYLDVPRPKTRPARVVLPEQKTQQQEENTPIEEIIQHSTLRVPLEVPKQEETKLPEPAPEVAVVPADIQQEPNTQDEPCLVIEAPKQEESKLPESALEVAVVPADIQQEPNTQDEPCLVIKAPKQEESKLPEPDLEIAVVPADIQQEPNTQDEPCLVIEAPKQEKAKLPEPAPEVTAVPARKTTMKHSASLRQKSASRTRLSTPIMPKMEEKADASQTFISVPTPQVLPFQKPGEKKRETEIRLAPPMTPLAKNEDKENENISRGNEAWKLEYFPVSIHCLLQIFTLGIFPYLWFSDRWKTFNQFSNDEKINTTTARSYIIFGAIAQVVAAVAIIFSLFIPEATLLSLSEKVPTGLGAWLLGFFAPKTLWMLYGFILCTVVLPLRTLIYFNIRWNIRMVANEWDPEERMAPRTIGSWLGLFLGGTAYLQHHINRLIALGMLVTDYEDDEWDAFQDPISFIRSLAIDSDDAEDPIPTRAR